MESIMSKNKDSLEKANITFKESKARLLSSQRSSEQLENKISHFSNLCIASIGGLATAISFLHGKLIYQVFLCVLLIGFVHSLRNLLKLKKTNKFASDGIEATAVIDHDDYDSKDSSSLLRSLAKTYENKANYNYTLSDEIAKDFDKTLNNTERYVVSSGLALLLGFIL
jgi:hypothetical protein